MRTKAQETTVGVRWCSLYVLAKNDARDGRCSLPCGITSTGEISPSPDNMKFEGYLEYSFDLGDKLHRS